MADDDTALAERLRTADLELIGRFADASNATLLVRLVDADQPGMDEVSARLGREVTVEDLDPAHLAVYKPLRGESPLWDFPDGTLHLREIAAHELSAALGWDLVPLTVLRQEAPLGPGSLQRFVPHDPGEHYFTLIEGADEDVVAQLRTMVVFDLVANNADRKGGHVLLERDPSGPARIRCIDHGVTFHAGHKLRTVAWEFAGEPLPDRLRPDLVRVAEDLAGVLGERMAELLDTSELAALRERVEAAAERRRMPEPSGPRPMPWPPL